MATTTATWESFVEDLQALWSAEQQLTEKLPALMAQAKSFGLKKAFAHHWAETDQQRVALEGIATGLGYPLTAKVNQDMKTILAEGDQTVANQPTPERAEAALIKGAIRVEHYEIERYTALAAAAEALGFKPVAQRLRLSLEEERQADAMLNFLHKDLVDQSSVAGAPGLALK